MISVATSYLIKLLGHTPDYGCVIHRILYILGYLALAAAGVYKELHQGDQRGFSVRLVLLNPLVNNALEITSHITVFYNRIWEDHTAMAFLECLTM